MNREINLQLFFFQFATRMDFSSICGRRVRFLDVGSWNLYAGPDFKRVRYTLDDIEFLGDVEIHLKSSDWFKHHHHKDTAYGAVHIHFVAHCDDIIGTSMIHIQAPTHWMDYSIEKINVRNPKTFDIEIKKYRLLNWIECYGHENAAFIHLARAMGRHVQGDALEQLAIRLMPIIQNSDENVQDFAMLFHGAAGQLEHPLDLEFYEQWRARFQSKYAGGNGKIPWNNKVNIPSRQWLKVSQLIFIHVFTHRLGYAQLLSNPVLFRSLLREVKGMSYWENHYRFDQKLPYRSKIDLSISAQEGIFMNTIPTWELAFQS
jgi:hypothetical protein